jgi:CMP/dCMP kinase
MRYRVVCISRAIGAGGEAVGHLVAERLGFRYFDDDVIALASTKAGLDPAVVATAEHYTSLMSRLMDALLGDSLNEERPLPSPVEEQGYYSARVRPPVTLPQEELRRLIQSAIVEIADRGAAVIVAHAASIALATRTDVLRILVTASVRTRCERLWRDPGLLNEEDAARVVADSDRERERYLERFFAVREEVPTLYDLVVNTDVLRVEQAVDAIVAAARHPPG